MANYTIELGRLVQSGFKIFDFDYDFYDDGKKIDFEALFIDKFYNYEICCETPLRWQRYLKVLMKTKFPYYNMLLVRAQISYDVTKNYDLTETQTRDVINQNIIDGTNRLDTSKNGHDSISNNSSFDNESIDIGNKSSDLDSVTQHNEDNSDIRKETQVDETETNLTGEKILDATKAHSKTPKTLLSLTNIKTGIYADDAEINDNKETDKNTTIVKADRENNITDTTLRDVKDVVNAGNNEASRNENTSNGSAVNNGSVTKLETDITNGTMLQNTNGTVKEVFEKHSYGDIGVTSHSDRIEKDIKLQQKLTTVYNDFFEECYDLFMQIW